MDLSKYKLARINIPLFKFLSKEYADKLIKEGSVRLTSITEFRNQDLYSNHILDQEEGKLRLLNHYDTYKGLVKDGIGTIRFYFDENTEIDIQDTGFGLDINVDNTLIYCTTTGLFNESVIQAMNDGKDACVMIFDPDNFFTTISETQKDLKFVGKGDCIYVGKEIIEHNPTSESFSHKLILDPYKSIFVKPSEYENQAENRAIWVLKNERLIPESRVIIEEKLCRYVLPIIFDDFNHNILCSDTNEQIGIKISMKQEEDVYISINYPTEIISPIIIYLSEEPFKPYLGFMWLKESKSDVIENLYINRCRIITWTTPFGQVFFLNYLHLIESISLHTVEDLKDKNPTFKAIFLGELDIRYKGELIKVKVRFLNNLSYPRYYCFLPENILPGRSNLLCITYEIISDQIVWKVDKGHMGKVTEKELIEALGNALNEFYKS